MFDKSFLTVMVLVVSAAVCGCHRIDHVARQAEAVSARADDMEIESKAVERSIAESPSEGDDKQGDADATDGGDSPKSKLSDEVASGDEVPDRNLVETKEPEETEPKNQTEMSEPAIIDASSGTSPSEKLPSVKHDPVATKASDSTAVSLKEKVKPLAEETIEPKAASPLVANADPNDPAEPRPSGDAYFGVRLDTRTEAAKIGYLRENGPAEKAGMKVGDVLVAIDGELIDGTASLAKVVNEKRVGDRVKVVLSRSGKYEAVSVTLGSRSNPNGE